MGGGVPPHQRGPKWSPASESAAETTEQDIAIVEAAMG